MEKEIIKKLVSVTKEIYNTIGDEDYSCILGKVKEIEMQIFALNSERYNAIIDLEEYDEYRDAVRCLNDEDNCLELEIYKDKYDRTYVLLFHFFDESSLKAEQDCVLDFLEDKIIEVEKFYRDIHNDLNNIYDLYISSRKQRRYRVDRNIAANLINASIVLNLFDKDLGQIKSEEFNAIKANDISGLCIIINSRICSCLMGYEFQNNEYLDFEANYMPNVALVDNCRYMHKHKMRVENVLEYNRSPLNHDMTWCEEKIFEIYKKSISNEIDFVKLQALLILIEQSPFFSDSSRSIAREMIYTFKELLVNISIEKLVMEINMSSSEMEVGAKTTTKMEIFFFLENEDRYCLRFDFPHEDAEYIHYNLHEPLHDTGLPLRCIEYKDKLMRICETPENINSLFFNNAKHYWFRFNFEKKLDDVFFKDENNKQELKRLFKQQCHCRCFNVEYDIKDVKEFLTDLSAGMERINIQQFVYGKTKKIEIEKEFKDMKIYSVLKRTIYAYHIISVYDKLDVSERQEYIFKLKDKLIDCISKLYDKFPYSNKEMYDMDFKVLIELCLSMLNENVLT